jgi:hypothetical protein
LLTKCVSTIGWKLAVLCVAVVAGGCGGVGATATGMVTIDGQPAPAGLCVTFQPQRPDGSPSMGITDATGRYELFFTAARKGVMPGDCLVRISIWEETSQSGMPMVPEALKGIRIPEQYGEKSSLIQTVKPGSNRIDIDIASPPPAASKTAGR